MPGIGVPESRGQFHGQGDLGAPAFCQVNG